MTLDGGGGVGWILLPGERHLAVWLSQLEGRKCYSTWMTAAKRQNQLTLHTKASATRSYLLQNLNSASADEKQTARRDGFTGVSLDLSRLSYAET